MYKAPVLKNILLEEFGIPAGQVRAIVTYPILTDFEKKIGKENEAGRQVISNHAKIQEFLEKKFVTYWSEHGLEMYYGSSEEEEDFSSYECNYRRFVIFTDDWIIFNQCHSNTEKQPMVTEKFLLCVPRNY